METAAADFETTTTADDCRVWAWGIADIFNTGDYAYGTEIQGFLRYLYSHEVRTCWFHNLGFDGKFIIDFLLRHDYAHVDQKNPYPGTFTTLISNKGKFYQIRVNMGRHTVTFKDSLKVFPLSIKRLAEAFKMDVTKGEIDYDAPRPVGHVLTDEEQDYLKRDVLIAANALRMNYDEGMDKLTIGANAFSFYKDMFGKKHFGKLFPTLTPEEDAFIRDSYRGGFTYAAPEFAGKEVSGISVDYTSMYPSMMLSEPYPVGKPIRFEGRYTPDEEHPLFIQRFTCMFHVKPKGIPMLQLRGHGFYGEHEYVRETLQPVTLTLTSIDIEIMNRMYDVEVVGYDGGYKFAQARGLFDAYINHWAEVKNHAKGGRRQLAKLMLNNLYGKFATNPDVTQKRPELQSDDTVHYVMGEHEEREGVYIPVGTFCTAYARRTLLYAILANRDRFAYCDTDSMHLVGDADPVGIPIAENRLCTWKVEGHFSRARHLRAKCYIWDLNGEVSVTCAGMPENVKALCTFDNFHFGFSNVSRETGDIIPGAGKLVPKDVPGGVVLVPRPYVLHE